MKNSGKLSALLIILTGMSGGVFAQEGMSKDQEVITSDMDVENDEVGASQEDMVEDQDPKILKTRIDMGEVPLLVQEALEKSEYDAAEVTEVYRLEQSQGTLYEFVIEENDTKWVIHYDESGNYVAKKEVG